MTIRHRPWSALVGTSLSVAGCLLASSVVAREPPPAADWTDSFDSRLQALALLETLNADLLSHPSATLTLERWCGEHHLADNATVTAHRVQGVDKPLPEGAREQLGIGATEPVRYRRVQLVCGQHVLSEADNWYVPARLTADMNQQLDHSDVSFGRVVQALKFHRQTLSINLLWSPLPPGWEMGAPLPPPTGKPLSIPPHVLQQSAILYTQSNQPFSLVVETYTSDILAFGARASAP